MTYQHIALLSAVVFAFVTISAKFVSKHKVKDFNSFFFWTYIAGLPFIILIPLTQGFYFNLAILPSMIVHSILLTAGQYLFSKGIFLVDASVVSPLFQLQSGFVLILAMIFLGEKYPPFIYVYLIFLILGAMFVSATDKTKFKGLLQKGVLYILGMQLFHAGANIAIGFALKHTSSWQTLFYSFAFNSILVSLYMFIKREKVTRDFSKVSWMLLRAFLLLIATALLYKAFETNISISAALGLLSSPLVFVIAVACAIFSPKLLEKQSLKTYAIRAVGLIMIIYGAWNITILK
ncbi:EamA family transporter [Patescibacteria group bacterium]